jgi:phage gpG-like protein
MSGIAVRIMAADVIARLSGMVQRGESLSPLFNFFGEYMLGSIHKNFEAGGRPSPWAPLSLGYLSGWAVSKKSFTNKGGTLTPAGQKAVAGRRPLIDTGVMMDTIFKVASSTGLQMVSSYNSPGGVSISAVQQFGARIPPILPTNKKALSWPGLAHPVKSTKGGVIPARPFMLFQEEDIGYFERLLANFVINGNFV